MRHPPKAESLESKARSPKPEAGGPKASAYTTALRMLGARELSERQVRERLARRGFSEEEIDTSVARLKEGRAIDDRRVAGAIARTQANVRRRGRLRVVRHIEQAGISKELAREAAAEVFDDLDPDQVIQAALEKRLRGDRAIADDREFQRLYRYLMTQGFESDRVLKALKARRAVRGDETF